MRFFGQSPHNDKEKTENNKTTRGCEEIVPKKTKRHITESSDGYVPFVV